MSDHPPRPAAHSPDVDADAWAQGLLQRQAARLEQLAEAGLRLALAIERRVSEAPAEAPVEPAEAAMAFARVARAVRLTALLQSKLLQDLMRLRAEAGRLGAEAARAAEAAAARPDPAYRHKARVEAVVERVAKAGRDDEDEIDRLVGEAGERLDDEDIYGQVLERPVGELVALICRDLGLEPDWERLAEEAWAQAEADDPRSPFFSAASPAGGRAGPRSGGEGIPPPLPSNGAAMPDWFARSPSG